MDVTVRNMLDGTLRLSFAANVAGTYDLELKLDEQPVGPNADALGNAIDSTPMRLEVAPGPLSPAHFKVFGAGVEFPAAVNEDNVMRIQTRDRFGNDRVDDGALLTLERRLVRDEYSTINMRETIAGYVFDVAVDVRVGEKWESSTRTYAAEFVNVSFVPLGGVDANRRYTDGTYAVNFRVAHAGVTVARLLLNQTYETRERSTNRILNVNVTHVVGSAGFGAGESAFEKNTGRTNATRAGVFRVRHRGRRRRARRPARHRDPAGRQRQRRARGQPLAIRVVREPGEPRQAGKRGRVRRPGGRRHVHRARAASRPGAWTCPSRSTTRTSWARPSRSPS